MRRGPVTLAYLRQGAFVVSHVSRWLLLEKEPTDLGIGDAAEDRGLAVPVATLLWLARRKISPADTAPLTPRAKLLMMAEALISLTIVVVLIGRSINIL
jgi:hypothetical protein